MNKMIKTILIATPIALLFNLSAHAQLNVSHDSLHSLSTNNTLALSWALNDKNQTNEIAKLRSDPFTSQLTPQSYQAACYNQSCAEILRTRPRCSAPECL